MVGYRNPLPTAPFVGDYIPEGQNEPNTIIEEHNTTEDGGWNNDLNHRSIDDDIQVKQLIRTRLQQVLINR